MIEQKQTPPSLDAWLQEAKQDPAAHRVGMYLFHTGVVRQTPKAQVREGVVSSDQVAAMNFHYDAEKVAVAVSRARRMTGIDYVRIWLNQGELAVGDLIMLVLVGGDIRPHVVDALQALVSQIKSECVTEQEILASPVF